VWIAVVVTAAVAEARRVQTMVGQFVTAADLALSEWLNLVDLGWNQIAFMSRSVKRGGPLLDLMCVFSGFRLRSANMQAMAQWSRFRGRLLN
jgi:hypothetical protein